jgi:hypothetical protein
VNGTPYMHERRVRDVGDKGTGCEVTGPVVTIRLQSRFYLLSQVYLQHFQVAQTRASCKPTLNEGASSGVRRDQTIGTS